MCGSQGNDCCCCPDAMIFQRENFAVSVKDIDAVISGHQTQLLMIIFKALLKYLMLDQGRYDYYDNDPANPANCCFADVPPGDQQSSIG